jgi:hypothetical protein
MKRVLPLQALKSVHDERGTRRSESSNPRRKPRGQGGVPSQGGVHQSVDAPEVRRLRERNLLPIVLHLRTEIRFLPPLELLHEKKPKPMLRLQNARNRFLEVFPLDT